jgi:hypothetical protein
LRVPGTSSSGQFQFDNGRDGSGDTLTICCSLNLLIKAEYHTGDFLRQHIAYEEGEDEYAPLTSADYQIKHGRNYERLNTEQKAFVDQVNQAVKLRKRSPRGSYLAMQIFMLTGDGGTGKSFAENVIEFKKKSFNFKINDCSDTHRRP